MRPALFVIVTLVAMSSLACSVDWKYYEVENNTGQHLLTATSYKDCEIIRLSERLFEWYVIDPGEKQWVPASFGSKCVAIAGLDQELIFTDRFSPDRRFSVASDLNVEASEYTGYSEGRIPSVITVFTVLLIGLGIIGGFTVIRWAFGLARWLIRKITGPRPGTGPGPHAAADEIV
jgi:hypothetical protein